MIDKDYPLEVIESARARYYREYPSVGSFLVIAPSFDKILAQEYKLWQQSHSKNDS